MGIACRECGRIFHTDKEIHKQTLALANKFYTLQGFVSRPDFDFDLATHPAEIAVWNMACHAQLLLLSDVDHDDLDLDDI